MKGRRASNQASGAKIFRGDPWASGLNYDYNYSILESSGGFIASLDILLKFDEWDPTRLQWISTSGNEDRRNGDPQKDHQGHVGMLAKQNEYQRKMALTHPACDFLLSPTLDP